ncbi:MAG TPA: hypothetical protein VFF16_10345 [Telluria sp.]|nr:hypothetical protein [Telluria sp.]
MIVLTEAEREFIRHGGALWYVRDSDQGWEVVRAQLESEAVFGVPQVSSEQAVSLMYFLIELAARDMPIAVHHAIRREARYQQLAFPPLR